MQISVEILDHIFSSEGLSSRIQRIHCCLPLSRDTSTTTSLLTLRVKLAKERPTPTSLQINIEFDNRRSPGRHEALGRLCQNLPIVLEWLCSPPASVKCQFELYWKTSNRQGGTVIT